MNDWIPAVATTSLLAAILWLCRNLISTRLSKSVQHEYDAKLATLRAELEKAHELFKAEIRKSETQMSTLQSGVLMTLSSRQGAIDKRCLEAVDQLWKSVNALRICKGVCRFMASIKSDATVKMAKENENFRAMLKALALTPEQIKGLDDSALTSRPYVSQLAWALFLGYQSILMHAVAKASILQSGFDAPDILDSDGIKKVLMEALPHHAEYIREHGSEVGHLLLDELEDSIVAELRKMLDGADGDHASVERAAAIISQANRLSESTAHQAAAKVASK